MGDRLSDWVNGQLKIKGWSMRELGRRAGLSPTAISDVLSGKHTPGAKFYLGIARAFDLPIESIERLDKEGIIPLASDPDNALIDLAMLAADLPQEARQELLLFAHYLSWRISHNLPL